MKHGKISDAPIFKNRYKNTVICHVPDDMSAANATHRFVIIASNMIGFVCLSTILWVLVWSDDSRGPETFLEKKKRSAPRGYYAGLGYPYLPFAEPLTILAGLAFLAYIIQAFHSMYHFHNHGLGGVLNNVLPSKSRDPFSKATNQTEIKLMD